MGLSHHRFRTKLRAKSKTRVTFKDVAGADEAKQDLEEILEFLKNPKKFRDMGARIPTGVLLYGPPGTGKTLLARAIAGEAGVPFFSISASEFVEMYVGVGASRVRDLFIKARRKTPSIVFIDEIDAVGRERGTGLGGGHDEREQTLNQLLVEMDGFSSSQDIVVIAATNRLDILDPALIRAGRFDRRILVDKPDAKGRHEILKIYAAGKPFSADVNLAAIARRTSGFTGADINNLVNEAAFLAIRQGKAHIEMHQLEEAVELVISGPERKNRVMSEKDRNIIAYHEAGHVLVSMLLDHTDPVHKVSIIPRGQSGGYTLTLPKEDRYFLTESELLAQIMTLLGGRVAESLVLGEMSTGAQNDLRQVADIAHKMVCEYGMSEAIGPISFGRDEEPVYLGRDFSRKTSYSEEFTSTIDKEIRQLIGTAYSKTEGLIRDHLDKLHRISKALLERETLESEELRQLLNWESLLRA
ncbi:MAG: ATP-dependent zinc metalloprotease FtsH [Negativicutes bacterium]|nr:ATP-dependent zinc metalloprotease FtsH [Negativicutes bacterium]